MSETELLFSETSPYGSVEAIVEQDELVAYFYLRSVQENPFGMKSCWIRNLAPAPDELDVNRMKQGLPPQLPKESCRHPEGAEKLNEKRLRIVWLEEGDGAALLEDDQILTVIPSWSGAAEGFDGYARDCVGRTPMAWELPENDEIPNRVERADRFWKSWSNESSPWLDYQPQLLDAYEATLGEHEQYYSIDGGAWPPKTMAKFSPNTNSVFATLGVSVCPQPAVETYFEHPQSFRRFEIGFETSNELSPISLERILAFVSGQTSLPWNELTFLAHGHTIGCDLFMKIDELPDFSSVLLWSNDKMGRYSIQLPTINQDPINLFWLIPLFENERQLLSDTGNYEFIEKWLASGQPMISARSMLI